MVTSISKENAASTFGEEMRKLDQYHACPIFKILCPHVTK
jgi:hypothetical protein